MENKPIKKTLLIVMATPLLFLLIAWVFNHINPWIAYITITGIVLLIIHLIQTNNKNKTK